ncbi:glycosyltransferase [Reichenbachiella agarivorans]|uniref:Glycosyltransferase n=1 Tax=Reichenbachiella agarivorans TaxID=2979464 RepID=A0ABY6CZ95_9BACT|nr:glycosyltransferase [Reichenbachiella agarivorans]UXP33555.1 glycosyltransferase [Reichenbachiella agarivorans]
MSREMKKIALVIPTCDRASILKENIEAILDEVKDNNIPIYISDDSQNDATLIAISDLRKLYKNIFYFKNDPSLGHDKNYIRTLKLAQEDYVWFLGDAVKIRKGYLSQVVSIIQNNYDFVSVNTLSRNLHLDSSIYQDGNLLLKNLGWHLTFSGSTIYSKNSLENIDMIDLKSCKNFPQISIIFRDFIKNNYKLFWFGERVVEVNSKKKSSYWSQDVMDVFLKDWSNVVLGLPEDYALTVKNEAIKSHTINSNLFSIGYLVFLRINGFLDYEKIKMYGELLKKYGQVNYNLTCLISRMPPNLLKVLRKLYLHFSS